MNIIWINQKVSLVLAKIREMKYSISIIYRMQLLAVVRKHSNNTNVQKIHRCIYSFSVMQSIYRQTFCFASTTKSYTMSEFAKTERILQYSIQQHLQCCIYWISLNIEIANAITFSIQRLSLHKHTDSSTPHAHLLTQIYTQSASECENSVYEVQCQQIVKHSTSRHLIIKHCELRTIEIFGYTLEQKNWIAFVYQVYQTHTHTHTPVCCVNNDQQIHTPSI